MSNNAQISSSQFSPNPSLQQFHRAVMKETFTSQDCGTTWMVSFRVSGNVVMRVADLKICRSYNGYN